MGVYVCMCVCVYVFCTRRVSYGVDLFSIETSGSHRLKSPTFDPQ